MDSRSERGRCDGCGKWKLNTDLRQLADVTGSDKIVCVTCAKKHIESTEQQP